MGAASTARGPRLRRVAIAVVVFGLIAGVYVLLVGGGHPGGDPGNRVFASLARVPFAIPTGATSISVHETPAQWMPACLYMPKAHAGWDEVQISANFRDTLPVSTVVADINRVLAPMGWRYRATRTGPDQGPIPHWMHPEPHGKAANAFAFQTPAGSESWIMTASWQPPGPRVNSCP